MRTRKRKIKCTKTSHDATADLERTCFKEKAHRLCVKFKDNLKQDL